MNTSPTKSSLAKLGLSSRSRSLRVLVLGQSGVGKTALVVRFVTNRFIGEYVSNQEKTCTFQTIFDNEPVQFEILDSAHHLDEEVPLPPSKTLFSRLYVFMCKPCRIMRSIALKAIFVGQMLTF